MRKNLTLTYISRSLAQWDVETFRDKEFARLFQLRPEQTYGVLHRLVSVGILRRLANGRYLFVGLSGSPAEAQPFYLGTRLVEPSYVSFWSALHYYGWTEQAPRMILFATTRVSGRRRVGSYSFRFVKLAPSRFFGYAAVRDGNLEVPLAEPEKAIVDSLYLPLTAGGMGLVASALPESLATLDVARLQSYAARMGTRSLVSRLGHLLARLGIDAEILLPRASSVYVKLDPHGSRRGRYDARWKVIGNLREVP